MNITNIDDIRKLASGDEGGRTEYKLITGQLERGMETLCAFLNGEGGTVLFGVADNGKTIGQEVSDKTKREIAEAIRLFEPFATITVSYANIPDTDKQVIALYAEEQRYMRPFTYKGRGLPADRKRDVCHAAGQVQPPADAKGRQIQLGGNPQPRPANQRPRRECHHRAVRAGINCGRLPETTIREEIPAILEKFDLLHDGKLNNAAAVLFGRNLYDYPQCLLRMARFRGTSKEEFIDNQRQQGKHLRAIDAAMCVFFKHLSLSGKIEGLIP